MTTEQRATPVGAGAPKQAGILVVGESLVDVVSRDGVVSESPGGSPANVALGLGRLGFGVRFVTALARDDRGDRIAQHLARSGVTVDDESWLLDRTSTSNATIGSDGAASYLFDIDGRIGRPLVGDAGTVHLGSISMVLQPGAEVIRSFLGDLPDDIVVSVDPNIRPALMGRRDAAIERVESVIRRADIVKLSDEDAEWLYPGLTSHGVLDRLLGQGPTLVAITLGRHGAIIAGPTARCHVDSSGVDVVDTIGAGDTFMAALLGESIRSPEVVTSSHRESLEAVGRYATHAAAITVQRSGADLPWASEL